MQSRCPYIHEREASQPEGSFKHGSGPVGFVTEPALGETKLSIGRDSVPASIAPTSPYRRYEAEDAFFYGATLQRIEDGYARATNACCELLLWTTWLKTFLFAVQHVRPAWVCPVREWFRIDP
eukprot:scaffold7655_cov417-Prasinococcus_capsulatus_cf.AAC.3